MLKEQEEALKELLKTKSRCYFGLCKNECWEKRRPGSAYCQKCSDKHNEKKRTT